MPPVKLDLRPMPDVREIHDKVWFRTAYDRQGKSQPTTWFDPMTEEQIQLVVNDTSLDSTSDKAKRLAEMTGRPTWMCEFSIQYGKLHNHANMYVSLEKEDFNRQGREPVPTSSRLFWFFKSRLVKVLGDEPFDEVRLRIQHKVLAHENDLSKLRREVEAFANFERLAGTPREPIPQHIQMFVWQRDRGQCVRCGGRERLEYDHIIPLSKGGSNTERNIQLLCEECNRTKGASI